MIGDIYATFVKLAASERSFFSEKKKMVGASYNWTRPEQARHPYCEPYGLYLGNYESHHFET